MAAMTSAERAEREAVLGYNRDPSAMRRPTSPRSNTARGPLGLAPAPDDESQRNAPRSGADFKSGLRDGKSAKDLAAACSVGASYDLFDTLAGLILELQNESVAQINLLIDNEEAHRNRIESLETTVASLAATVTELRVSIARLEGAERGRAPSILRP